jgi:hypothetical protein
MFMVQYHFCKCDINCIVNIEKDEATSGRKTQPLHLFFPLGRSAELQSGGFLCSREALSLRRRKKSLSRSKRCDIRISLVRAQI